MNTEFDFTIDMDSMTMVLDMPDAFAGANLRAAIEAIRTEQNRDAINAVLSEHDMPDEFFDGGESYDVESAEMLEEMLQILLAVEACVESVAGITYDDWTFMRAPVGNMEVFDDADVVHTIHILDHPYLAVDKTK